MDGQALVTELLAGRAQVGPDLGLTLREPRSERSRKLRATYRWLADVVRPAHRDLGSAASENVQGRDAAVALPGRAAFSSFLLLPLLALVTRRRLLLIGAPGRGKTTVATLMAMLAGIPRAEVRRMVQRGHPQLTVADLLGSPLPGRLVDARDARDVVVEWRGWLTRPVKIVDEYNRIPTKTQSALLSLMAEGYAEQFEQTVEVGDSAWFLTANDDLGGGTFPVIEALRDRIDVVVRCHPVTSACVDDLVARVEGRARAPDAVPSELVFAPGELDAIAAEIRGMPFPPELRALLAAFASELEFCGRASRRLGHMSKDTLHLAGRRVGDVCTSDCPLDKRRNPCAQTEGGLSARGLDAAVHLAKALAYFLGAAEVGVAELGAVLPWVLHEKLAPNTRSAFFDEPGHRDLLLDRVEWIEGLFRMVLERREEEAAARAEVEALRDRVHAASKDGDVPALERLVQEARDAVQVALRGELTAAVHARVTALVEARDRALRALGELSALEV